jgi:type IV secretory pathway VirB2 component (pilin)
MNVKKVTKIVSAMLIVVMLVCVTSTVFAAMDPGSISGTTGSGATKAKTIGQKILGIVQVVGSIVAVIALAVLGIKYMMGSAEEKAEYKKTLIPYFIGALLVFGAGAIGKFVVNAGNTIAGTGTGTGA